MTDKISPPRSFVAHRKHSPEFKKEVVDRVKELGNVASVSAEKKVDKSLIRQWVKAFNATGLAGLQPKSTRPHRQPRKTAKWVVDKIIKLKEENPELGSGSVSDHLKRFASITLSAATIGKLFKKNGIPDGDAGHAEARHRTRGDKDRNLEKIVEAETGEWERFARPNPNDMWQMDIKYFHIRDAHRVYLISALDDCSRFIVNWGLFKEQTADNVLEVLRGSLAKHGAPGEILTDQGAQFKQWNGVTRFEKLLAKLRIKHIKARSHHPQTCGKIEAFHKTLTRELLDKEFFFSQEHAAEKIGQFVEHYNYARPHTSLDGHTPSDRYFGVIDAMKKYLKDHALPAAEGAEPSEDARIAHQSKVYLVGRVMNHEVRVQEIAGRLSLYLNGKLFQDINLAH
jgi:transposase InsO family protein